MTHNMWWARLLPGVGVATHRVGRRRGPGSAAPHKPKLLIYRHYPRPRGAGRRHLWISTNRENSPPPLAGGGWGEGFHAIFGRHSPSPRPPPARGGGGFALFVEICGYRTDGEATRSAPAAKARAAANPMDEWAYNFISRPIKNPSRPPRSGHIAGCVRATPADVMASGRPGSSSRVNGSNRTPPRVIAA